MIATLLMAAALTGQCGPGGCSNGTCPAPGVGAIVRPRVQASTTTMQYVAPTGYYRSVVRVSAVSRDGTTSVGTGVVATVAGRSCFLLTAEHVVRNSTTVSITTVDGRSYTVVVKSTDPTWDFALCSIQGTDALDCCTLAAGTEVPAIGTQITICDYSRGRLAVSSGPIRGFAKAIGQTVGNWLMIPGRVISGISGGPMFTEDGRLAGVVWGSADGQVYGTNIGIIHQAISVTFPDQYRSADKPQPQEQQPPQEPATEEKPLPSPVDGRLSSIDLQLVAIDDRVTALEKRQPIPGPAGPPGPIGPMGPMGPQGLPGQSAPPVAAPDIDDIVAAVIERLPPVEVRFLDGKGQVASRATASLGGSLDIPSQRLQTLDSKGKVVSETTAPLGFPMGLKSEFISRKGQ